MKTIIYHVHKSDCFQSRFNDWIHPMYALVRHIKILLSFAKFKVAIRNNYEVLYLAITPETRNKDKQTLPFLSPQLLERQHFGVRLQ